MAPLKSPLTYLGKDAITPMAKCQNFKNERKKVGNGDYVERQNWVKNILDKIQCTINK